jgi:hypothetical protein
MNTTGERHLGRRFGWLWGAYAVSTMGTWLWGLLAAATSPRFVIGAAGALLLATPLLLPRQARGRGAVGRRGLGEADRVPG